MDCSIATNETPSVKLKGVGDGFWVTINPAVPEEEIYKEISELFGRLKHLAVNAKVVVDIGNSQGYDNLIDRVKLLLKSKFNVGRVAEPHEKISPQTDVIRYNSEGMVQQHTTQHIINTPQSDVIKHNSKEAKKQSNKERGWINDRSDALILTGRIRSGQKIETKGHLIIAGNVNPGAQLTAAGNIIVLGSLMGEVCAGYPDDEEAFVMALDFRSPHVQIGGVVSLELNSELSGKTVFATVQENKIIIEDYLKTQPFGKIPWPTVM